MTSSPDDRLRAAGLRVTAPRVAVLEVLTGAPRSSAHLSAAAVVDEVRARRGAVSVQAVYDCLDALAAAGLVRRIEPAGHPALFEARVGDNHHHLVCRGCGVTVDVDCSHGSAPCLAPADPAGFEVDEAEVVFWGRCPACRAPGAPGPAPARPAPEPRPVA